jgi:hypothetical protein
MREELTKKLLEDNPKIFPKFKRGDREIDFYFEVGDGWYPIIARACCLIQNHVDWKQSNYVRSNPHQPDDVEPPQQFVVVQIKEKFGGLRFYGDYSDEFIDGVVSMAEGMSYSVCEECGDAGIARTEGWIKTLCDKHHAERQEKKGKKNG